MDSLHRSIRALAADPTSRTAWEVHAEAARQYGFDEWAVAAERYMAVDEGDRRRMLAAAFQGYPGNGLAPGELVAAFSYGVRHALAVPFALMGDRDPE